MFVCAIGWPLGWDRWFVFKDLDRQHIRIAEEIGDRLGEGNSLLKLAIALKTEGEIESATDACNRALAVYRCIYGDDHPQTRQAALLSIQLELS